MKRILTTLFIFISLVFLSSFTLYKLITFPAWYRYSGPYNLEYKYTNYQKGKLYFYFDHTTVHVDAEKGYSSWTKPQTDSSFTAYFVNATDTTVTLTHQDGSLIMIQEAQDQKGKWSPIEVWYYSDCGNSYFNSPEIGSNQYVQIPIPKYRGSFQTHIRLKLKLGKGVFYSEPFNGSVDPQQFKKVDELGGFKSYLDEKGDL